MIFIFIYIKITINYSLTNNTVKLSWDKISLKIFFELCFICKSREKQKNFAIKNNWPWIFKDLSF